MDNQITNNSQMVTSEKKEADRSEVDNPIISFE